MISIPQNLVRMPICVPGQLTQTSLELTPGMDFDEWESIVQQLAVMDKGVQWWLGDALNYGERAYGEMYAQAIEATGFEYQRLANYKWVSSKIEFSTRVENLSWTHHREVADLSPDEQAKWLELATTEKWSSATLRVKIELTKNRELEIPIQSLQMEAPVSPAETERIVEHIQQNPQQVTEILTALAEVATGGEVTHTPARVGGSLTPFQRRIPLL